MGEKALENRVKKLKALEAQQKALEKQIEELKKEIKEDMIQKGMEQQAAGDFIIRFSTVITSRFDSKRFQQEHAKLYGQYIKQTESHRFSIA